MSKHSRKKIPVHLEKRAFELLYRTVNDVASPREASDLLNLMFTAREKKILIKRCVILILLEEGRSYSRIQDTLDVSRSTISKINCILKGDGYGKGLKKIIYSADRSKKSPRERLLRPYKGAKSIL